MSNLNDGVASTRVIDLSHRLVPGKQRFMLEARSRSVQEYLPDACWIRPIAVEPIAAGRQLAEIFLGTETLWES